jgi:L-asparagine transporter-like permease
MFYFGQNVPTSQLTNTVSEQAIPLTFLGLIGALQAIFYTYDGWHTATYFTEENTDPAKTLPKSHDIWCNFDYSYLYFGQCSYHVCTTFRYA